MRCIRRTRRTRHATSPSKRSSTRPPAEKTGMPMVIHMLSGAAMSRGKAGGRKGAAGAEGGGGGRCGVRLGSGSGLGLGQVLGLGLGFELGLGLTCGAAAGTLGG
eukprot:scaffold106663_cov55-Phaeocystis_antarctica.AAC.2